MKSTDIIIIALVGGAGLIGYLYFTKSGPFSGIPSSTKKYTPYESQYERLMDMMTDKEDNKRGTSAAKKVDRKNPELTIFAADRYNREQRSRSNNKDEVKNTIAPDSELEWYSPITEPLIDFGETFTQAGESTLEWFGGIPKAIGDVIGDLGCAITRALGGTCGSPTVIPTRDIMGTRESADYALNRLREAEIVAKAQSKTKRKPASKAECDLLSMYGLNPISGGYC